MKALTLTQPWASLVACGAKRIETRSWRTPSRGLLAIHAARGFPADARDLTYARIVRQALASSFSGIDWPLDKALPLGSVIATARLISCLPTRELQKNRLIEVAPEACCEDFDLDERERSFGNYDIGRWAWLLADIKALATPVPAKGALGLWEWNPELQTLEPAGGTAVTTAAANHDFDVEK